LVPRQRTLLRQHLLQRRAGDVLEHRVETPVGRLARVDERDDVRVRELRAQPGLAPEALDLVLDGGARIAVDEAEHLARDQLARRPLSRLVDAPEAAAADGLDDLPGVLEGLSGTEFPGRRGNGATHR